MKKVLKITINSWHNASRDKRELSVLRELGADVVVMAKGKAGDNYKKDNVDGYDVFRFSTRPLGEIPLLNPLNRFLSLFIWAIKAKKFNADIISGHDLFPLLIGWLSNIGRKKKAKLVYDSHEFELGRNTERSKLKFWIIKHLERFLINRCSFAIMVNESIANEVQKIHKLTKKPLVIRNVPPYWKVDDDECKKLRNYFCDSLSVSYDFFIGMYHGAIASERGIELFIEVISKTKKTVGIIMGSGDPEYLEKLKNKALFHKVQNKILFVDAVPINELWKYVGAADFGIITPEIISKSYYYGLGNKFFECIQSKTPIICNNTPEMARIINKYKIGLTIDPIGSIDGVVEAINTLSSDKELYSSFKVNLIQAKIELCWENEKQLLVKAYENLICSHS